MQLTLEGPTIWGICIFVRRLRQLLAAVRHFARVPSALAPLQRMRVMHSVRDTRPKHRMPPQAALDAEKAAEMAPLWPKPHYRWAQVCAPDEAVVVCFAKWLSGGLDGRSARKHMLAVRGRPDCNACMANCLYPSNLRLPDFSTPSRASQSCSNSSGLDSSWLRANLPPR